MHANKVFLFFPSGYTKMNPTIAANASNSSSNTTNRTTPHTPRYWYWDPDYEITKMWCRGVAAFVILVGNFVCLVAFLGSKSLRKRPHYLLVHLCLADFLVGVSVLLRLVVDFFYWKHGNAEFVFASFTFTLDYFSSIASINVLTSIAIERFLAVVFPLFHRMAGKGLYALLMGIPWLLSTVTTITYIFSYRILVIELDTFEMTYLIVISIPIFVIFISYTALLIKVRKNHVQVPCRSQDLRDRKLAITLLIVTLASVITWGPYNVYYVLTFHCEACGIKFSGKLFFGLIILQYWNSGINLVVYFYRMPQFRQVILACCRHRQVNPQNSRDSNNSQPRVSSNKMSNSGPVSTRL